MENQRKYGEYDCSFFVIRFRELQESLRSLHSTYFDTDQKRYRFAKTKKSEEFKFLYILEELSKESKKVLALPIAKEGEFVGFNTEAEARKIEEILNRENV